MSDLTVLVVTRGDDHALPFIKQLTEDAATIGAKLKIEVDGAGLNSLGFVESVLDQAVAGCDDGYILRIDDDETLPVGLMEWLRAGSYRAADHWAFPRRNLWPDQLHYIANAPLWPDLQTRLSVKAKAAGRPGLHDGSPYGTGRVAPCAIDHHKFLARGYDDRLALAKRYDDIKPGAGTKWAMFTLPELYIDELQTEAIA